ncbi:LpxI family protein [Aestuariicoccus sp. MJ-SS9]|uniref:LpxI family protein n=1 Tax=Aestuariicoccus sp. MJ-SS9 TaxID=3079855 RepID=UPI00291205F1|nr:UDP-2,3-diacylglucosamine diphosphatase LpxI [Aestuariicoccus sp. MJ-SS9]MDU8913045.1 UDP-2,3-diacylglucosamine diphosphatase LpxI [Aestuariicoccus sp. MJ-SS9]
MLALIAGAGALPAAVVAAQESRPFVCALQGFAPEGLTPDMTFRIETLGTLLQTLTKRGVTRVCLCGHIRRPEIDLGALDDLTLPLVPQLRDAMARGDDGALRGVIGIFEAAGFQVLAAHEAAPALLPPTGVLTEAQPPESAAEDAAAGDIVLAEQGRADLGQACVIRGGRVLAREDDRGTDAMLTDAARAGIDAREASDPFSWAMDTAGDLLGGAADWLSGRDQTPRDGLLFKGPKPGQDRRADLPVIGPGTVQKVAQAGLGGIVIEAGGVMVLDRARVIRMADAAGLFLWVRERPV